MVDDLESLVSKLTDDGVRFRNDILEGPVGKQILCTPQVHVDISPDARVRDNRSRKVL